MIMMQISCPTEDCPRIIKLPATFVNVSSTSQDKYTVKLDEDLYPCEPGEIAPQSDTAHYWHIKLAIEDGSIVVGRKVREHLLSSCPNALNFLYSPGRSGQQCASVLVRRQSKWDAYFHAAEELIIPAPLYDHDKKSGILYDVKCFTRPKYKFLVVFNYTEITEWCSDTNRTATGHRTE